MSSLFTWSGDSLASFMSEGRPGKDVLYGKRVLLVEDLLLNQTLVREMTRDWGISLECVGDGEEALRKASSIRYDVILLDILLPVMDGWQVAGAIRDLPDPILSSVPIVALSASFIASDRLEHMNIGMDQALIKPFDSEQLRMALLGAFLRGDRSRSDSIVTPEGSGEELAIDLTYLNRVGNGNPVFVRTMLRSFVQSVTSICAEMEGMLGRNDRKGIAEAVHKLKFALGVVGVKNLKGAIDQLENRHEAVSDPEGSTGYQGMVLWFLGQMRRLTRLASKS